MCEHNWLTRNKDTIGAISGIVSMVALTITACQVLQARNILETQASVNALRAARGIMAQIEQNPAVASKVYSLGDNSNISEQMLVSQIISLYSEQFLLFNSGILNSDHWIIFKNELCSALKIDLFRAVATNRLESSAYPQAFAEVIASCMGKNK